MTVSPSRRLSRMVHTTLGRYLARTLVVNLLVQGWPVEALAQAATRRGERRETRPQSLGLRSPVVRQTSGGGGAVTAESPVFGPKDYQRATGSPVVVSDRFTVASPGSYTLRITNGGTKGQFTRVSSAIVTLNGVMVVAPHEFNPQVATIERIVPLSAVNTLSVELRGQPGSGFTLQILGGSSNRAPVADAGPDQTVPVGQRVQLDGSRSSDVDGDPLTHRWSLVSRPAGSTATIAEPTSVRPSFVVDVPGRYDAQLVVNDGHLDGAPDTVAVVTENSAPVAHAGSDQRVLVGTTVTLDGTASRDVDGNPLTFLWTLTARPAGSAATLTAPTAVRPTFVVDVPGAYAARLVVNDGLLDSTPDEVTVTTANTPPVANAGPDQTVFVGTTVTLDGSTSGDVDGDPLTFRWALTTRPTGSLAVLSDATAVRPTFVVDRPGMYVAQLVVGDGFVDSAPDTVVIDTQNSPPVADAGPDQSARVGTTITLDGSGSSDVDGNALTFRWTLIVRPTGSGAALSNPTAVTPTFVLDAPGTYVAQLIINDGTVDSAIDTVTITTLNSPPLANAGPDQTVLVGSTVDLDGSASGDVDGDPLTFRWALTARPAGSAATLSDPTAVRLTFAADIPGTYVAQLTVHDGTVESTADSVTISTQNSRPVARAGPDQTVTLGDLVTLDGRASSDADGDPLSFQWAITARPAGSGAALVDATAAQPTFTPDVGGTYLVQLIVSDPQRLSSDPDSVTVTVRTPSTNLPPVVNAGPDQSVTLSGLVTLNGGATDDGLPPTGTLTVTWTQVGGPGSVSFANPSLPVTTVTFGGSGAYVLRLTATDGELTSSDEVTIAVSRDPVLTAVVPATVTQGQTVSVLVTGQDTHFAQGVTTATFGAGINVGTLTVSSPERATMIVNVDLTAAVGSRTVTLVTGAEVASLPGGFQVVGASTNLPPAITSTPPVARHWTRLAPSGTPPSPRSSAHSAQAYDAVNDRVMFFGGWDDTTPLLNDAWVLANASGVAATPSWIQLHPSGPAPSGKYGYTVTYAALSNRLIVVGGAPPQPAHAVPETWVLTNANGLTGVPEWIRLPDMPVSRVWHTSTYDPGSNRLTVFGGTIDGGTRFNDVWVLTDADGVGNPSWFQLAPEGAGPAPRESAAAAYDPTTNRMMLFGGFHRTRGTAPPYVHFNDGWVLTNANGLGGTAQWVPLSPSGTAPDGRFGHTVVYGPAANELILFGGLRQLGNGDSEPLTSTALDDTWVLREANGVRGGATWTQLAPTGARPVSRFYHAATFVAAADRLLVSLGRHIVPPGTAGSANIYFNDAWALTAPGTFVSVGQALSYDVEASDPNAGDVVSFSVQSGPPGLTIDAASGMVTWSPALAQLGEHSVTIQARDAGGLTAAQTFVVTVVQTNGAPFVSAGADRTEALALPVLLQGTVTDDGLPFGHLRTTWTRVSGPGVATFADAAALTTSVTFSVPGTYVLRLTADDDWSTGADDVTITVGQAPGIVSTPPSVRAWTNVTPLGSAPLGGPVGVQSSLYDTLNDRLLTLADSDFPGGFLDPWVLVNATGAGAAPGWQQLQPPPGPGGRRHHAMAYMPNSNRAIILGGYFAGAYQADTWVLTGANGLGATPAWLRLPDLPSARYGHAAVHDAVNDRLIVFAGNQASTLPSSSVFVLTDAAGIGNPTWLSLSPTGTPPPPTDFPSTFYDSSSNRLVVMGGLPRIGPPPTGIWILTHANGLGGQPEWLAITPAGPSPSSRWGQSFSYDPIANTALLVGGQDPTGNSLNDTWVLQNANGLGGVPRWVPVVTNGPPLDARGSHAFGRATATDRLVVTLGELRTAGRATVKRDAWVLEPPLPSASVGQRYTYDVDAADADAGEVLTYTLLAAPSGMTIVPSTGLVEWIPTAAAAGLHRVSVRVTDTLGLIDTQTYTLAVAPAVGNQPPTVSAGPDQNVALPAGTTLVGLAVDDGLPAGSTLSYSWSQVSGPGVTSFGSPTNASTSATFSTAGVYVLRLTASDGQLTGSDDLVVTVTGAVAPLIVSVSPSSAPQGSVATVTITGQNTHFSPAVTQVSLGAGIDVSNIVVGSPTRVTALATVAPTAAVGPRTVTLTTGAEVASLPIGFQVTPSSCVVPPTGLAAWWPGEGNASDVAGGHIGSLGPDVTFAAGRVGQGFRFAGVPGATPGAIITVPHSESLNATSVTLDAWVRIAQAPPANTDWVVATKGTAATAENYGLYVRSVGATSALELVFEYNPGTGFVGLVSSGSGLRLDTLHHVAVTADGSTIRLFVDGQLVAAAVQPEPLVPNAGPLYIGAEPVFGSRFNGVIDELSIYNRALADHEVQAIHAAGAAGKCQTIPALLSVAPNSGVPGQSLSVAIVGQNTHFAQGTTLVDVGSGISVTNVTVVDATHLVADLSISTDATSALRTVTVTSGGEVVRLVNAFAVGAAGTPALVSVVPSTGTQGQQNLDIVITGQFTHFAQGVSTVFFNSATVAVNSVTVTSPTRLVANVSIALNASLVPRTVTVTTGTEVVQLANGFTVLPATNQAPVITIAPTWTAFALPGRLSVTYSVSDDGLPNGGGLAVSWQTVSGPGNVGFLNQTPTSVSVGFDQPGTYVLRIQATDTQLTDTEDITVTVNPPVPGPIVLIASPIDGGEVTGLTPVVGTVTGASLTAWTLETRMQGETTFRTLATGSTPVANAPLGTFDPTLLLNGIAEIQLTATDAAGQMSVAAISVVVSQNLKVGNFTVSFNDLTVPVAGLPIQVVRTYDSRDKRVGDFGVGWRLDVNSVTLTTNGALGDRWMGTVSGALVPTYCIQPERAHVVTVTFSDGTLFQFQPRISPQCQAAPPSTTTFSFAPAGTTPPNVSLAIVGSADAFVPGPFPGSFSLLDLDAVATFDPRLYQLTMPDGRVLTIHATAGLQSMRDLNGNTLTVTPTGISHSSGKSVTFQRDGQNRITRITDPNNNAIRYTYDGNGDLATVTDAGNSVTTFGYNATHGLLTIQDPRGVQPIRNEYDDNGRLIRHTDAFGFTIDYTHDLNNRQEIVRDRLGNVTVNEYDDRGNVVRVTDARGGVTTRTYDARNNVLTETNPLNQTRTYTYDANDNRLTETDPRGRVTTYTYNARNQVLRVTDPRGKVTTNVYNAQGNQISTADPLGNTTTSTYDARGLLLTTTDPLSHVTAYAHDASGNLTRQTDALGHVTEYTYDANGNRRTETRTRTTPTGTQSLVTTFTYDGLNRLTQTTFPDGSTTRTVYNAIGKQASTFDQLGRETQYTYDLMGRLVSTTFPDGSTEATAYDAEGRRTRSTDRVGRVTGYAYDQLGRLIRTTFPDGTSTRTEYDAAGQVLRTLDALDQATTYGYDAAGRRTSVTDALNHITTFDYDEAGNQTRVVDANGHITQYVYDDANRRIRTVYHDGSDDEVTYDALGRTVTKTDQADVVTTYNYDALGRLLGVVDANGGLTSYAYDEVGNRVSQTDALGRVTRFEYDAMGRRERRTLPLGMSETSTYNAAGNMASKTDFNGRTTTYAYDALNRLTRKTPDPVLAEPTVQFSYLVDGQRSQMVDASGTTTYTYDIRGRLLTKATPQGTLTYGYHPTGTLASIRSSNAGGTSVDYAYDAQNRLQTVTDNRITPGVTSYTYDNAGSLATVTYPNGVIHTYTYNELNRLTNLVVAGPSGTLASYAYTLGPSGNRTAVAEHSGRQVGYTYDALYRLTGETVTMGGVPDSTTYTYDDVGNRLVRSSSTSGTTTYGYDDNDRLLSDTYDANGNTIASRGTTYSYDFENHLTGQNNGAVTMVYDGDGDRVAKTVGGVTTRYLVDTLNLTGYAQVLDEVVSGAVQRHYVYGLDLVSQNQASGVSFYGYDGHNSVRALTDSIGTQTDAYDYDVYGVQIASTGSTANEYLFAGEARGDGGLMYLRSRWLSPALGRFTTLDHYAGADADPISRHGYIYANDSPANRVDPAGTFAIFLAEVAATSIRPLLTYGYAAETALFARACRNSRVLSTALSFAPGTPFCPFRTETPSTRFEIRETFKASATKDATKDPRDDSPLAFAAGVAFVVVDVRSASHVARFAMIGATFTASVSLPSSVPLPSLPVSISTSDQWEPFSSSRPLRLRDFEGVGFLGTATALGYSLSVFQFGYGVTPKAQAWIPDGPSVGNSLPSIEAAVGLWAWLGQYDR